MTDMGIRTVGREDAPKVGAVLVTAFAADPYVRWLMPSAADFVPDSIDHPGHAHPSAFDARTVYVLGNFEGVAIWEPPEHMRSASENSEQFDKGQPVSFPADFAELNARVDVFRPDGPHWYLAILAVDMAHRGKGIGTALMEHSLAIADRDHLPTFLQSSNASNLSLYRRFGFDLLAQVSVGASPSKYPMLRAAR